jgi:hypothetical protein
MTLDVRYEVDLADTQLCGPIQYISPLVPDQGRIMPGKPEESNVHDQIAHQGRGSIPPLTLSCTDGVGAHVVADWIRSMESCLLRVAFGAGRSSLRITAPPHSEEREE